MSKKMERKVERKNVSEKCSIKLQHFLCLLYPTVKVYHIKLTDQSALEEKDLDKIVEDVANSDPRLSDGDRSKKIIEVDLSSKKGASSLLAQAIEQYIVSF